MTQKSGRFPPSSPRGLRVYAGLIMLAGLGGWIGLGLLWGNLSLAFLYTLMPASALFTVFMVQARKMESETPDQGDG